MPRVKLIGVFVQTRPRMLFQRDPGCWSAAVSTTLKWQPLGLVRDPEA